MAGDCKKFTTGIPILGDAHFWQSDLLSLTNSTQRDIIILIIVIYADGIICR